MAGGAAPGSGTIAGMAIIDLGLDRAGPPDTARPFRISARLRQPRSLLVAAAALLVAVLAGGATVIGRPVAAYASVPLPDGSLYRLTPDTIYVMATVAHGTEVDAYDPDGRLRWGHGIGVEPGLVTVTPAGPATLLTYGLQPSVVAVDPATGDRLWYAPASRVLYAAGRRVLLATGLVDDAGVIALSWCDAGTGRTIWTRDATASEVLAVATPSTAGVPRLVALAPQGLVRTFDLADDPADVGATLAAPGRPPVSVFTLDGLLMVVGSGRSLAQVQAYRADGFRPLWTTLFSGGGIGAPTVSVSPCVAVLCEAAGDDVRGLVPGTGTVAWEVRSQAVRSAGPWLVATPASATLDDSGGTGTGARVLDPATGATLLALPTWQLSWANAGDGAVFVDDAAPAGLSRLATLAPGTAAPRLSVVGAVARVTGTCQRAAGLVGCPTGTRLSVWRA